MNEGLQQVGNPGIPEKHPREEERIARLLGYNILDTEDDPILDRLTAMASQITGAPISLISLVDRERQWVKSRYGIDLRESSRKDSFCAHAILEPEGSAFVVEDSLKDPRFQNNPFVTGEPHIRFYAGIPLRSEDGLPIGSLCVIDSKPSTLTGEKIHELEALAGIAMDYISVHRSNRELTNLLLREKEVYNRLLSTSSEMAVVAPSFDEALHGLIEHLDPALGFLSCRIRNMQTGGTTGIIYNSQLPKDPELPMLWNQIDASPHNPTGDHSRTEFISTGALRPEFSFMVVPVRIRERLVAVIELIFPDHRKMDPRIREVFDVLSTNLGIVAERELVNVELKLKATRDELTGVMNRNVFIDLLEQQIADADPENPSTALIYLDLDGFKNVNDNFGHQIGDRLLVDVSKRLREICRDNDLLGRLSGDEFVILLNNLTRGESLDRLLERIRRHLVLPYMLGELEIRIGLSIGCALLDSNEISTTELLRRAEEAMYMVKKGEKKDYCIADAGVIQEFKQRRTMDRLIREAVKEKRMTLMLQPIVDSSLNKIVSAEMLLRVLDRSGRIIEAVEFMDSLDRTRILPEVDDWVFSESLRILHLHRDAFSRIPSFRLSINVSPAILATHGFAAFCLARLKDDGIPPAMLQLEIVESHLLLGNPMIHENLNLFRESGMRIAVDDFGTGYSNLQYLTGLPIDTIKIDRLFLKGILTGDTHSNDLLTAIINIGKNLGYSVIVEGVEEEAQSEFLRSLGCNIMQGYLFGKPMPVTEFLTIIKSEE